MSGITNVFVLMMENRSFDHLFALSGIKGVNPPPAHFGFQGGASDRLSADPPHENEEVLGQVHGGAMDGFAKPPYGGPDQMKGFAGTAAEVHPLVALANDNLLMDNWFSSMPGPTWPNRYFAHAGSSGGLDNSLSSAGAVTAVTLKSKHLKFDHRHVFERMGDVNRSWRVYHGDTFPQALSLRGMIALKHNRNFFRPYDFKKDGMAALAQDLGNGDLADYTFIEPKYDSAHDFKDGFSQHPWGSVALGTNLIIAVHNAIFTSPAAAHSLLVVTWDEHGGFFDQKSPPAAVPPGDKPCNHDRAQHPQNFAFDVLGVRVPTILISPWMPTGLGSQHMPKAVFDHSAILRGLRTTFSLGPQFTNRDGQSPDWNDMLLTQPRKISPINLVAASTMTGTFVKPKGLPNGTLTGTSQIAADLDCYLAERDGSPPLLDTTFKEPLRAAQATLDAVTSAGKEAVSEAAQVEAEEVLLAYLQAVASREASYLAAAERG